MSKSFFSKLAFWQSTTQSGQLGVYLAAQALWVFQMPQSAETDKPTVESFPFEEQNLNAALSAIKQQFGAAEIQFVLGASHYQLLQADKPNVDEAEINQALIWQVKDMVSEPVTDIQLDYFETSVSVANKVNVVIASKPLLVKLATACDELGLTVAGISVEELMFDQLFSDDAMAHLIVVHLPDEELLLTVVKAGELLMQRRVRGFAQLDKAKAEELSYGMADNLSLEIQRSMDYFESQLRQAPVASISVLTDGESDTLAQLISANFNQKVQAVEHQGVAGFMAMLARKELSRGDAA
ncbi:biogenesis protein MshI [Shewanella maritima]|uniref:biogenesis protein MshI n=1 Tax=Shewanella maritima TaxID=2520507 RepID=UPI003735226A